MDDLISRLQKLGDGEHDDLDVAHEALAEIVRLRMELAAMPATQEQQSVPLDLAAAAKQLRIIRSGACPTTESGWRADAMYVAKAALRSLNNPSVAEPMTDDE